MPGASTAAQAEQVDGGLGGRPEAIPSGTRKLASVTGALADSQLHPGGPRVTSYNGGKTSGRQAPRKKTAGHAACRKISFSVLKFLRGE